MNRNPSKAIADQPLFGDPAELFGRSTAVSPQRNAANAISEGGISDPGPLVSILYLADDLRSVTFHGYDRAWPAKLDESLAGLMLAQAPPLHRLTPALWARVWRQVLSLWDQLKGNQAKQNELLDLMEPVLDFVRDEGWEPRPE